MVVILAACSSVGLACTSGDQPSAAPSSTPSTSTSSTTSPSTSTPSAPSAGPSSTAPVAPEQGPREFTVVATGDVLLHEPLWAQAERDAHPDGTLNFAPQLSQVKPVVSAADLALCHLEVPLAEEDGPFAGFPAFAGPPQVVPALVETGYDACTTASNHVFDQGAAGVDRTLNVLDEHGLAHAGSARTEAEAAEPTIVTVDMAEGEVDIGLLSYTFSFNGVPYPGGEQWRSHLIDEEAILAEAAAARQAGADVVIVSMHWGDQYVHEPNTQQRELAPRLIASADIDLLLGHHAHVVQPMEVFDGEWVVYGVGNAMANHAEPTGPRAEGLLVRLTFTEDEEGAFEASGAEYLPLYQTHEPPLEVVNVPRALDRGEYGTAGRERLRAALDRTSDVVTSRGGDEAGLEMIGAP